jgi:hypothetical protein
MNLQSARSLVLFLGGSALCLAAAAQMSPSSAYLPPPDPGYGLYYHGDLGLIEAATRWGYHDGWKMGREARSQGRDSDAKNSDNFKKPPKHGDTSGINQEQYERVYQSAFLRGYERGYRL